MRLHELVAYLDEYLRTREVPDWPEALNGLQVENRGAVTRVAAAVDASEAAVQAAAERGCDLLLVHHGLFWDGNRPLTGRRYRRVNPLLQHDIAVYSSHLPLDLHPEVGNNAVLARELGIELEGAFAQERGVAVGVWGNLELTRDALAARLEELHGGRVRLIAGGPEWITRVGVVTGAGGSLIGDAIAAGLDAYITGEGPHHTYFDAVEGGINVYYAGHYATEVWGVRALAAHLAARFGLPWEFLDLPTGL
ncbi:MAG: Nif3-like dinuclear metal center hexameric protein [Gemmatimonadetes bacterium]|nr:Nif3-like dinuclear metal center hexameric protein [Gemmatimonadota bacterium]